LSLKTLYRKRTVIWPFYFYTIIRTLSKKILQTYIEQASIIIDFIELYQQNEDPENQLLWEQRLEMIGQSDINDRE
ncbi:hypothetical protein ABJZ50_04130, partial [Enterococcus sp. LW22]